MFTRWGGCWIIYLSLFNFFNCASQNGLKEPVLLPHLPYAGDDRHMLPFNYWRSCSTAFVIVCPPALPHDHQLWVAALLDTGHIARIRWRSACLLMSVWVFWFLVSSLTSSLIFAISFLVSLNVPLNVLIVRYESRDVSMGFGNGTLGLIQVRQGLQAERNFSDESWELQ